MTSLVPRGSLVLLVSIIKNLVWLLLLYSIKLGTEQKYESKPVFTKCQLLSILVTFILMFSGVLLAERTPLLVISHSKYRGIRSHTVFKEPVYEPVCCVGPEHQHALSVGLVCLHYCKVVFNGASKSFKRQCFATLTGNGFCA